MVFRGAFAKQLLGELSFSGAACTSDADTDKLDVLFKRLLAAANEPVAHERSSALLYEFILLAREQLFVPSRERNTADSLIKPALDMMEAAYMRDITLAESARVTPQHFCRVFKARLGSRPLEYLARLRISKAKQLLVDTDMTIAEIAAAVGYSDQTYFGVVFKRYEGMSPSAFRRLGAFVV